MMVVVLSLAHVSRSGEMKELWSWIAPWDMVRGRDGQLYQPIFLRRTGGQVIALTREKAIRSVHRFPYFRLAGVTREGSFPSAVAAAPDGAIYGVTALQGVFGCGTLFKIDRQGRYSRLLQFSTLARSQALLVSEAGVIYAATHNSVLRLGKDGALKEIQGVVGAPRLLVETNQHAIWMASYVARTDSHGFIIPDGVLSRFEEATERFESVANLGATPLQLIATPDGGTLCSTSDRLLKFSSSGAMSVIHDFSVITSYPFVPQQPNFITVALDGSYIGSTTGGVPEVPNAIFRVESTTNQYSVVGNFLLPGFPRTGWGWVQTVYPIRLAAEGGNQPPAVVDDFVPAESLRPNGQGLPEMVIPVLRNDGDADRDPLTIVAVSQPAHGTATLDFVEQKVTYTAGAPSVENDSFTYTVVDGSGGRTSGDVFIRTQQAGRYGGAIASRANPDTGDPGTAVGWLDVKVNKSREVAARVNFQGKTYRFTARLNPIDRCASVLHWDRITKVGIGIELSLRASGEQWIVDAVVGRSDALFYASCPLDAGHP